MRYIAPAIMAALTLGGCACTGGMQEQEPEPASEIRQGESVPLLEDIPLLGHLFRRQAAKAESSEVPLLTDIPILGTVFKRKAKPAEHDDE